MTEGFAHGWEKAADRACRVSVVVCGEPVRGVRGRRQRPPVRAAGPGLRAGSGCRRQVVSQLRRRRVQERRRTTARSCSTSSSTAEEKAALKSKGYKIGQRHRGLQHRRSAHEGAPGDPRPGGRRRRRRPERPQGRRQVRRQVRRPGPGRHRHPARRGLHGRGRPEHRPHDRALPLRRGVQQVHQARRGLQHRLHRPVAGALHTPAPTVSTTRRPTWVASSTRTRRRTSTCTTGS